MTRATKGRPDIAERHKALERGKANADLPPGEERRLEERIERLEDDLEDSVRGNRGLGIARSDRGLDGSETEDSLRRAVERSKRGSRKA